MKKIISLVLALAMVALCVSALADDLTPATSALPRADIQITNLESGDTVKLYKIAKWDTTASDWAFDGTFSINGYDTVDDLVAAINNDGSATSAAIANAIGSKATENEGTANTSGVYTYNAEVGMYLALVTTTTANVYNPMILSVNFTNPTTGEGGTVDATSAASGTNAKVKKTHVTLEKEVKTEDKKQDVAVGDTVDFIVRTVTPNYGDNYQNPVFRITDTLSTGIEMTDAQQDAIVVKNGAGDTLVEGDDKDYTITASSSGYEISFTATYLHAVKANTAITVEYSATVNAKAVMHNVEEYVNDVDLEFSNSPTTTDDSLHDDTKHYTFSIDASLLGSAGGDEVTKELVKIAKDNNGDPIYAWETSDTTTWRTINPLQGAEFTLVGNDHTYTATSDPNGYLNFTGLDVGEYVLTEISAPAGYKFSTTGVPVVISATYNTDGTLATYSITVDSNKTSTYTATNAGEWTSTTTINDTAKTTGIVNEEGVTLPSTGGIGTTIFYILGGLLVVGAAVILVARRKAQD